LIGRNRQGGSRSNHGLIALLVGLVALFGVQALAAAPAGALLLEYCTDMGCETDSGPGGPNGPSADHNGGIPADPSSGDAAQSNGSAGNGGNSSLPGGSYPGSDKDTSSFDPKNDGLEPSPFEDPFARISRDALLLIPSQTSSDGFSPRQCEGLLFSLNLSQNSLQGAVDLIDDPWKSKDPGVGREIKEKGLRGARQHWRVQAMQRRQDIRRIRTTRAGAPATTALAGMSLVTTALVPITELSPTRTPRRMQAP
jgi:hypothetical protein